MIARNNDTYNPPFIFRNKHFNTSYRTLFQRIETKYKRRRITTSDNDFLDLDIGSVASDKVVVIIHGLEGSSDSIYIKSLSRVLNDSQYDVIAVNLRGCSGSQNLNLRTYHSGETDDLREVLRYIDANFSYDEVNLAGFSLGGNIILKYLGEEGKAVSTNLNAAVTISVPCDLEGSSIALGSFWNKPYMIRFLRTLKQKAFNKLVDFPDTPADPSKIRKARNFYDFDNAYTAPVNGFRDAVDYWTKSSSKQYIPNIKIPTLLISAKDDPFLSNSCYPIKESKHNKFFNIKLTKYGGHVGFNCNFGTELGTWSENQIAAFLSR